MRYNGRGGRVQGRTESRVEGSAAADLALVVVPVVLVLAASYPALAAGAALGAVAAHAGGRARRRLTPRGVRVPAPEKLAEPTVRAD